MAEQHERRRSTDSIEDKIDGLIGMLTHHAGEEEHALARINTQLNDFFHNIDAHKHVYHHGYVEAEIESDKRNETRWEKIKTGMIEKALIFLLGSIATYLVGIAWMDLGNRMHASKDTTTPTKYEIIVPKLGEQPIQSVLYTPSSVAYNDTTTNQPIVR